ncbi:MAG: cytochrome c peroxidase [Steroidobacteraceae bacterium]
MSSGHRIVAACAAIAAAALSLAAPLGLPPVPVPATNPQTPEKIALGDKLFNDKRFSSTGAVACATCHDPAKAFTDSPLTTSEGINKLTGTRNAPTVINAAYFQSQFWDGRSPDLEDQALHPFVNPVEMGLADHEPILAIVRSDPQYVAAFAEVFGTNASAISIREVTQAIAAFERTIVGGDSPFDRYYFGGDKSALSPTAIRGFDLFLNKARCVSCHTIEQDSALFTDSRFHNIGVGINRIQNEVGQLAPAFLEAKAKGIDVDKAVLADKRSSELGRFAITDSLDEIGAFKTSTLRNVAVTAPFMHDGSLKTLREVVEHYNNGGVTRKEDPVNDFLSGGIRPLDLTDEEISDLVAFLESLTSPQFAQLQAQQNALNSGACDPKRPATAQLANVTAGEQIGGINP